MMRSRIFAAAFSLAALGVSASFSDAAAQRLQVGPTVIQSTRKFSPGHALASLVIPGSGQVLAGRKRGFFYLAAEAVLVTWHLRSAAIGRRERNGYRDLA